MARYLICLLGFIFLQSCEPDNKQKEPFRSLLKNCEQVNITFYNKGDTLHFETRDTAGIKILSGLITGSNERVSDTCKPAGELYFKTIQDTVLHAQFSISLTSDNPKQSECEYATYHHQSESYTHKMNNRAARLLQEIYASGNK